MPRWREARHGLSTDTLIPIVIAGSFGICAAANGGPRGMIAFYRRGLDWRMGWPVFCVSVFLLPLLAI